MYPLYFSDSNEIWIHNNLVRKQTLNHIYPYFTLLFFLFLFFIFILMNPNEKHRLCQRHGQRTTTISQFVENVFEATQNLWTQKLKELQNCRSWKNKSQKISIIKKKLLMIFKDLYSVPQPQFFWHSILVLVVWPAKHWRLGGKP